MQEINPNFQYPPQRKEEDKYACSLEVRFSSIDLSLTNKLKTNLENIALTYEIGNKS